MRFPACLMLLCAGLTACGGGRDDAAAARRRDSVPVPAAAAPSPGAVRLADSATPAPVSLSPMTIDTATRAVLDLWPIPVAPERQIEETRRIVEHLQADLVLLPGFEQATLLASGDGARLILLVTWRDDGAADRGNVALTGWLHADTDSAVRHRRLGTATTRVTVRRTVGTPPTLSEAAMLQFTRYILKPGHSFGALAALADSSLALRVVRDTAAQGGATLMAADSGALYMMVQARTATALDPNLPLQGPLPFWAPFATRDEQLLAVVASIRHR